MERNLLLILLSIASIHHEVAASKIDSKIMQHSECGIYLAESTIPGAGLGMFAGDRDYKKGEGLTYGDLMVPLFELDWHNEGHDYDFLWDEYTWAAGVFNNMEEEEIDDPEQICVASFGMGAAVNCMLPLVNVRDAWTKADYFTETSSLDNAGLSSESPGVGAFTPYHGRPTKARRDIPAGQELYVSYGEEYFLSRDGYDFVPLRKHYPLADRITMRFQILTVKLPHMKPSLEADLWKLVKNSTIFNSRLQNALYDTSEQALQSLSTGGAAARHYHASIRSVDWLKQNGACMDNIKTGISSIPDAGRGAFARRTIRKGEIVTATPLIHVPDRNVLTMYDGRVIKSFVDTKELEHILVKDDLKPSHKQLLLNYCFGHRDSTLLLCPYGYLSPLINHSKKEANAKITWSPKPGLTTHPEWFNQTIKEWGNKTHAGLSIEYIALRDIEESEEILIDYGKEWEEAWRKHVKNFDPPRPDYIPAFELNRMADLRVNTVAEYDYMLNGVTVFCRRHYVIQFDSDIVVSDEWEGFEDEWNPLLAIYPCRVIERHHDDSYDVELIAQEHAKDPDINVFPHHKAISHILFNVPRDIFFFRDQPNYRDHHQPWSFRHDMRIPDEIFPEAWKNRWDPVEAKVTRRIFDDCDKGDLTCAEL